MIRVRVSVNPNPKTAFFKKSLTLKQHLLKKRQTPAPAPTPALTPTPTLLLLTPVFLIDEEGKRGALRESRQAFEVAVAHLLG